MSRPQGALQLLAVLATCLACASAQAPASAPSGGSITLNVTSVAKSGDPVLVSWTGIANPTIRDAIVLYVPFNATPEATVPAKIKWVNQASGWETGSGSTVFNVLNQRQDGIFVYFRNITINGSSSDTSVVAFTSDKIVAKSAPLPPKNYNEPTQAHLALTTNSSEMVVQWVTRDAGTPMVMYGTAAGQYTANATGNSTTYTAADMCGPPANATGYIYPGRFQSAILGGLLPATKYYYVYGDPVFGFSSEASFTSAPPTGPNVTVNILAWADSGQATNDGSWEWDWEDPDPYVANPVQTAATNTLEEAFAALDIVFNQDQGIQGASAGLVQHMLADYNSSFNPTLAIHEGDISYARGGVTHWDVFFEQYEPLLKNMPYMTVPGNHERDWPKTGDRYDQVNRKDSGGECGVPYERRIQMPLPGAGKQWYAFSYGPIRFIQFSTEQPFGAGSEQFNFILNELQTVNRSVTPWLIVGYHRPMYTTSIYGVEFASDVNVAQDLSDAFEKLFYIYEVDMTWQGHVHTYSRTCPVLQKTCLGYNATDGRPLGPVHMSIGNGGFEFTWFTNPVVPPYWENVALEHGYTRVTANQTRLHITAISSIDGRVFDDFVLKKPASFKPNPSGKKAFLENFQPNYVAPWWENPGLSVTALWGSYYFDPTIDVIQKSQALLNSTLQAHLELIDNPNAADTVSNLSPIFDIYMGLLNSSQVTARNDYNSTIANKYLQQVLFPLWTLFHNNAAAQKAGNGFAGQLKGPTTPTNVTATMPAVASQSVSG